MSGSGRAGGGNEMRDPRLRAVLRRSGWIVKGMGFARVNQAKSDSHIDGLSAAIQPHSNLGVRFYSCEI